jgi:hypothetical protein
MVGKVSSNLYWKVVVDGFVDAEKQRAVTNAVENGIGKGYEKLIVDVYRATDFADFDSFNDELHNLKSRLDALAPNGGGIYLTVADGPNGEELTYVVTDTRDGSSAALDGGARSQSSSKPTIGAPAAPAPSSRLQLGA